jgi:hypothetical protein
MPSRGCHSVGVKSARCSSTATAWKPFFTLALRLLQRVHPLLLHSEL